jgi:hypothetical protein
VIEYKATGIAKLAGIAYQSDIPIDLTGAKRIKFFVMGEKGGEKVTFMAIGKDIAKGKTSKATGIFENQHFSIVTQKLTLTDKWTRIEIPLDGKDISAVKYPFALQVDSQDSNDNNNTKNHSGDIARFYIKNIIIDTEEPIKRAPLDSTAEASS